jgi:hypothetical protein
MNWLGRLRLWWVPLLLFLTPVVGFAPAHRDLIDFFAPMRGLTATMLRSGTAPWLNLANGCGEAWFANPETAVMYPPAWLHIILPGPWALAGEIALHLALLSLGIGLLARDLGASRFGRSLTEVTAWSAGPVLVTVGVLNNLETLTWIPWMVLAARHQGRMSVPSLAVMTALGWLGGEPQLWAIGCVLVVATARRRVRAVVGIGLGVALVAVQIVPFLIWVAEGDRGSAASWLLQGAVTPADWSGVLAPGLPANTRRMVYAESLFLGAPIVMCALLGAWRRRWVLAVFAVFALLATLPEIGGGNLFVVLTGGLVRYPSRFALLGLAILVPLVGNGADAWLDGRGRWLAVILSTLTLGVCALGTHPWRWWLAGGPALVMLIVALMPVRGSLRSAVLVIAAVGVVIAGLPLLGVRPVEAFGGGTPVWPEASGGVRVYAPTPARDVMRWLASDVQNRRLWPVGYLNLEDGLTLARTDAPIANTRLASHIALTDEGPVRRWWLDTLAAGWVILPADAAVPEGMSEAARHGVMRLLRNRRALPVVSLADGPPDPAQSRQTVGEIKTLRLGANSCSATFDVSEKVWVWVSLAPVTGWRWRLNGEPITLEQGPGIVQYLGISAGIHRLEGRYRPPLLVPLIVLSWTTLVGVLCWLGLETRHWYRARAVETKPDPAVHRGES